MHKLIYMTVKNRKIAIIKLLLAAVLFCFAPARYCRSAPCYGTKTLSEKQLVMGYQTYHLTDRDLEDRWGRVRSLQHFLLLSYGLFDWLTVDLKGGVGYVKANSSLQAELDYPTSFAGGYGFRIKLYDRLKSRFRAVFGFHHISVHPRSIRVNGARHRSILDDWQVSLLASYDVLGVTPYIGTKWSRVDYIHWVDGNRKRRMSDLTESMGLVAGLDIPLSKKTSVNLEGHFIDEAAYSVAFLYSF